ncbi:MAG: Aspartyl/glutamyl-tRNA(Asn/Gln) amidotransferase subunit B [Candidatus Uhrbacteria bacterium GW2011_GWD2_52_7]|uniref:Aspartyl/glutamyl-tRNA(Asn/Gln) amidotransferase subunit B n=1 Tax=Candidatus Uhrbacteria bacterium GW2011_GWD2_52_7 TaxID=1618989 RepID=A0A0G1XBG4_9BACT|nr:MAG: Aspartyl/glutamyl-tRNA(Asn/Gln) amidotransferase subunit B [Candidatus Uhrbacteria bacterium GW2011_GWD2_52_7]
MPLIPVIGLETHVQLKTKTKMFCACSAHAEHEAANTNICPICMGHPGTLPVPNAQAVRFAILLGLALGGKITPHSKFDRKNYFYPDLPKAYQISQFDLPVMSDGELVLEIPGEEDARIGIERAHLEEDAAKNIHGDDGKTYVDFNRGGVPLVEIVTRPDFTSAAQAKAYVQELRLIVRTLGISDGDMERGHLRCDVNVSLREVDEDGNLGPLNPKTEIKNINSFRAVERAIQYEIQRQTKLWEEGTPPTITTTRGWNDVTQRTDEQRTKEGAADYRYFPEPDIPPLALAALAEDIARSMPELPSAKRRRFVTEFGFKLEDARHMVDDPAVADFVEAAYSELGGWLESQPEITPETMDAERKKLTKLFAGWLITKLAGLLEERGGNIRTMKVTPENFAEFITLLAEGKITNTNGLKVLERMLNDGSDPEDAIRELGATRMDDVVALRQVIELVVAEHPNEAERYRAGEAKLLAFFLGQVMKATQGSADAKLATNTIKEVLS